MELGTHVLSETVCSSVLQRLGGSSVPKVSTLGSPAHSNINSEFQKQPIDKYATAVDDGAVVCLWPRTLRAAVASASTDTATTDATTNARTIMQSSVVWYLLSTATNMLPVDFNNQMFQGEVFVDDDRQ